MLPKNRYPDRLATPPRFLVRLIIWRTRHESSAPANIGAWPMGDPDLRSSRECEHGFAQPSPCRAHRGACGRSAVIANARPAAVAQARRACWPPGGDPGTGGFHRAGQRPAATRNGARWPAPAWTASGGPEDGQACSNQTRPSRAPNASRLGSRLAEIVPAFSYSSARRRGGPAAPRARPVDLDRAFDRTEIRAWRAFRRSCRRLP